MSGAGHVGHGEQDIAYHVEWGFRKEGFRWKGGLPHGANFHPSATEFHQWLRQRGHYQIFSEKHKANDAPYTNPYTYRSSVLCSIYTEVFNDSHDLANSSNDSCDAMEAEIQCIRIYNEQVLYTSRLCECLIKQLLYCTQIGRKYYEDASLGGLLSTECRGCRGSKKKRHKLSLLGSLGHRYGLCIEFEQCLFEHLTIVGRRRNVEAAHSDSPIIMNRSVAESRAWLMKESIAAGEEFAHMLQHLSDLETHMLAELNKMSLSYAHRAAIVGTM